MKCNNNDCVNTTSVLFFYDNLLNCLPQMPRNSIKSKIIEKSVTCDFKN